MAMMQKQLMRIQVPEHDMDLYTVAPAVSSMSLVSNWSDAAMSKLVRAD